MTTDLEKQFFDTFDIKQREYTQCCSMGCKKPIQIVSIAYFNYDVEEVKKKTLRLLMTFKDDVYSQVQELFKEGKKC